MRMGLYAPRHVMRPATIRAVCMGSRTILPAGEDDVNFTLCQPRNRDPGQHVVNSAHVTPCTDTIIHYMS